MSKSENKNAKVFFRIFPLEKIRWDNLKIKDQTVYMRNLLKGSLGNKTEGPPKFWEFKTDGVFFNSNQEFVYTKVMEAVLDRVIKGCNGIIVAFGQTGTGKSLTLGGLQLLEEKSTAADLLKEYPNLIDIYRSREATKIRVKSEYEALMLLYKGEGRKTFANNDTYMSHLHSSVVTFHITTKNQDYTSPEKITSRLHIIDMAGVDTVGNISSLFKNAHEIGRANIIKTNLEEFLLCLMKNVPMHIKTKERTNPLIYFLGSDLSNESILRFIGHIRVLQEDLVITISMLRFGQLVRGLKPKMKELIYEMNEESKLQYIQDQLEELQKDRLHCSVLLNQDLTRNLNQDRINHIQKTIQEYLKDQITEINILNVAEASEAFKEFKEICNHCEIEKK
ncbi:hypothetical protein NQ314_018973 [Rhamnusium bicolor]|uniref:Kinesin motor domain-containing protein n=1 Tax=Rhamnusium bicolor TaxID=1586634 RepID=A0AAV8WPS2_9CUCU|nr:hypothetical protein NQ314_018973 [Rhamnusium bicolor]